MPYAENTTVTPEKTLSEIQTVLKRYGASKFGLMDEGERVSIMFEMGKDATFRRCKMFLPLPPESDFVPTETGRYRKTKETIRKAWEQAVKARYRSLLLVIKAKLEGVASGIETFDQAFLPYFVLPNGLTVAEIIVPQVERTYVTGEMPMMMLTAGR